MLALGAFTKILSIFSGESTASNLAMGDLPRTEMGNSINVIPDHDYPNTDDGDKENSKNHKKENNLGDRTVQQKAQDTARIFAASIAELGRLKIDPDYADKLEKDLGYNGDTTENEDEEERTSKITDQNSDDNSNLKFYYNLLDTSLNGKAGATFRIEDRGSNPITVTQFIIKTKGGAVTAFYPNKGVYSQVGKYEPFFEDGVYKTVLTFDTPFRLDADQICEGRLETSLTPGMPFTFSPKDNGGVVVASNSNQYTAGILNKNIAAGPGNNKVIGVSLKSDPTKAPNFDNMDQVSLSINAATYESLGFDVNTGAINYAYTDSMGITSFESFCQRNQNSDTGQRLLCGPVFAGNINDLTTLISNNKLSAFVTNIKNLINNTFGLIRFDITPITNNDHLDMLFILLDEARLQLGDAIKIQITLPSRSSVVKQFKSEKLSAVVSRVDNVILKSDYNLVGSERAVGMPVGAVSPVAETPFSEVENETVTETRTTYSSLLAANLMKKLTPIVPNQCLSNQVEGFGEADGGYGYGVVATPHGPVPHDCVTNPEAKNLCPSDYPTDLFQCNDDLGIQRDTKSMIYGSISGEPRHGIFKYVNCPSKEFPKAVMALEDWGGLWLSEAIDPVYTGLLTAMCSALSSNCPGQSNPSSDNGGFPLALVLEVFLPGLSALIAACIYVRKKGYPWQKQSGEKQPLLGGNIQQDQEYANPPSGQAPDLYNPKDAPPGYGDNNDPPKHKFDDAKKPNAGEHPEIMDSKNDVQPPAFVPNAVNSNHQEAEAKIALQNFSAAIGDNQTIGVCVPLTSSTMIDVSVPSAPEDKISVVTISPQNLSRLQVAKVKSEDPSAPELDITVKGNSMAANDAKRMVFALNSGTTVTLRKSASGSFTETKDKVIDIKLSIEPLPKITTIAALASTAIGTQLSQSPKSKESKNESSVPVVESNSANTNAVVESKNSDQKSTQSDVAITITETPKTESAIETPSAPVESDSEEEMETVVEAPKKAAKKQALVMC